MIQRAAERYRKRGFCGLCYDFVMHFLRRSVCISMMEHRHIMNYLKKNYAYVIEKYKNLCPPPRTHNYLPELRGVIWTMWWQGTDEAPDVVRLCWAGLKKHCGKHKVIIITKDNYQDYVTLPDYILAKVRAGYISLTHLSDIIRVSLLAKYGGLWIDSTIFTADEIPEEIFSMKYYTIKFVDEPDYKFNNVSFLRWSSFFFAARDADNLLFSFVRDMLCEYLKTHDKFMRYVQLDYTIAIAFEEFSDFHDAWKDIPVNNSDCWILCGMLDEEYTRPLTDTRFFKLTWKKKFNVRTAEGRETIYGHLLSEYGITPAE